MYAHYRLNVLNVCLLYSVYCKISSGFFMGNFRKFTHPSHHPLPPQKAIYLRVIASERHLVRSAQSKIPYNNGLIFTLGCASWPLILLFPSRQI